MTITVDLPPDSAQLARQATAQGRAVEEYAAILLEEAVHIPAGAGGLSQERLENTLREMAHFSRKIPGLSDRPLLARVGIGITTDAGCGRGFSITSFPKPPVLAAYLFL